jgi:para-aminobenzoate synthetase component 1
LSQKSYSLAETGIIKRKMLQWASHSNIFLFLDNNAYQHTAGRYECLCGKGAQSTFGTEEILSGNLPVNSWLMGHFCYDLKNEIEPRLHSKNTQAYQYENAKLFVPESIAFIRRGSTVLEIISDNPDDIFAAILAEELAPEEPKAPKVDWRPALDKDAYLQCIASLREHIRNGDCYEINLCNAAAAANIRINPISVFTSLNQLAPNPFAACYRDHSNYALCASPERFLLRENNKLTAQPIKGTIRRGRNPAEDEQLRVTLASSTKDRAENVMITDLMRNDLARICNSGTVQVEELFGLYTFPKVHQMISTISGQLKPGTGFREIIKNTFPMGSMTGAPKIKVMELIDRYEPTRRELFSGSLGYIEPNGDFDLNVMIRSIFYNEASGRLSYQTGGAITYDSDPEQEWEETRLKAAAIEQIFQ